MPDYLGDFQVLDCGDVTGTRYHIDAIAYDANDTSKAASVHVASCYTREMAEMIVNALVAYQRESL